MTLFDRMESLQRLITSMRKFKPGSGVVLRVPDPQGILDLVSSLEWVERLSRCKVIGLGLLE